MKIAVYAISKNEEKFVDAWVASMSEADAIYVLDTGSQDGTVARFRAHGVTVETAVIDPWRFDVARNRALDMVPKDVDICVSTDIDEVFRPGWRKALEQAWTSGVQQANFRYTWNFNPDGSEGFVFWREKIHARQGFTWVNPVHEVLSYLGPGMPKVTYAHGVQLDHHADAAKSRAQYLPLLELAVREDPDNDRNMHYLGREYLYYGRWEDCVATLRRHLAMPNAQWADERSASLRYIARAEEAMGHTQKAQQALLRACGEAPWLREPWLDLAQFCYRLEDFAGVLYACRQALTIQTRPVSYISEGDSWGPLPYDLAALASYYLGDLASAAAYGRQALTFAPGDTRLLENQRFYENQV